MAKRTAKSDGADGTNGNGATIKVTAPNMQIAIFMIEGTSPLVQNKFSEKAKEQMRGVQEAGPTAKTKKQRTKKDFEACYKEAMHIAKPGGWHGLHAAGFRNALISACRLVGFTMTRAKLSIFCEADGHSEDGTPLVKILKGKPKMTVAPARNANGSIDLRSRPMWAPGWRSKVRLRYDADQFTAEDVGNLLLRVGMQVGIAEGRPDSKQSNGMDWGLFKIVNG